ncbi:uncharacterized protein LOC131951108 [Physella acuta]|uniref:uncharacterized protein LOC131951108 n=1 Tax=Physella acuta TaxID=109671 RepID=UPI0027DCA650|nr:uncharacterized protein LOC131951108 [Physella acuta]
MPPVILLIVLVLGCYSRTSSASTCQYSPVDDDEIKQLIPYFDKTSSTKILEYTIGIQNNDSLLIDGRWFRTQGDGSYILLLAFNFYYGLYNWIITSVASIETKKINISVDSVDCYLNKTDDEIKIEVYKYLLNDFGIDGELQIPTFTKCNDVQICRTESGSESSIWPPFKCCGYDLNKQFSCFDEHQDTTVKALHMLLKVIAVFIDVILLYYYSFKKSTFKFYYTPPGNIQSVNKKRILLADSSDLISAGGPVQNATHFLFFKYTVHKLCMLPKCCQCVPSWVRKIHSRERILQFISLLMLLPYVCDNTKNYLSYILGVGSASLLCGLFLHDICGKSCEYLVRRRCNKKFAEWVAKGTKGLYICFWLFLIYFSVSYIVHFVVMLLICSIAYNDLAEKYLTAIVFLIIYANKVFEELKRNYADFLNEIVKRIDEAINKGLFKINNKTLRKANIYTDFVTDILQLIDKAINGKMSEIINLRIAKTAKQKTYKDFEKNIKKVFDEANEEITMSPQASNYTCLAKQKTYKEFGKNIDRMFDETNEERTMSPQVSNFTCCANVG